MTDEPSALGDPNQPLRHRAFFEAAGELPEGSPEFAEMTAGLLVLRLLDKWPASPRPMAAEVERARDADIDPVEEHVAAVDDGPVRRVLSAIVDATREFSGGGRDGRLSPLIAYAQFLEDSNAWEPAADAFATAIEIIAVTGRDADLLPLCYGHAAHCWRQVAQPVRAHELLSTGIEIATNQKEEEATAGQRAYWLRRMRIDVATLAAEILEQSHEWDSAAAIYLGAIELIKEREADKPRLLPCYERAAYCLRQVGQIDQARELLHDGVERANELEDVRWSLYLRISNAVTEHQAGDLPEAEFELDTIIVDAEAANEHDILARATHERGMVAYERNQDERAADFFYGAARTYTDPRMVRRALTDLAMALAELGHQGYALRVFRAVRNAPETEPEPRVVAGLNLMRAAAVANDRTTFDQLRDELDHEQMSGRLRAHYWLFVGQGLRRFGEKAAARRAFEETVVLAEQHRVYKLLTEAEAMLSATDDRPVRWKEPDETPALASLFADIEAQRGVFAGATD